MEKKLPLKVIHVTGGMNRRGAETMVMNMYREIDKSKIQFDFISYSDEDGDYEKEIKKFGGRTIHIDSPKRAGFLKYLNSLKTINRNYGPNYAIHSHTLFNSGIPLLCAKIIGIPIRVCHAHSTSSSSKRKKYLSILYQWIMRKTILFSATKLVACGQAAGKYLFGS